MPIDIKPEKVFLPLMIFAAVIGVYLLFRGSPTQSVTVPSPASSGVPVSYTLSGGVQPATYAVQGTPASLSPAVILQDPMSANPGGNQRNSPPPYLAFNYGPFHDLTKPLPDSMTQPATSGDCECGGSCGGSDSGSGGCPTNCNSKNAFPDGQLSTPLSSTRSRQVNSSKPHEWLERAAANVRTYMGVEAGAPTVPNITSRPISGALPNPAAQTV